MLKSLTDWNHWWRSKKVDAELLGSERTILKDLIKYMDLRKIITLVGVRRSGKSTIFYQLIDQLLKSGIEPTEILLVNFEDDVLSKKTLKEIYEVYRADVNPGVKPFIFLDEVHRCKEWELFLRKLYDLKKVRQIFITDSSSKFIKPEYASTLTGRDITIEIHPLSFSEYHRWRGTSFGKVISSEEVSIIRSELRDYLMGGGFPEIFQRNGASSKLILTQYFSDIIHRDIVERYNADYSKIKTLADFLLANTGSYFSLRKFSRSSGLSLETLTTYSEYFKEVFLFSFMPKFSYSLRSQQLSSKKIYVCDAGFFNNVGFVFSENVGRIYENTVFNELKRRGLEVYYWKNKHECDFLVKKGTKIVDALQVCYELTDENREREIGGLLEAMNIYKLEEGILINSDLEEEEEYNGKQTVVMPLWKWLLGE